MSVFEEMHPYRQFGSWQEFDELLRMLSEAINCGFVEEVPVMREGGAREAEKWYRDRETGDIYSLLRPEPPARGWWARVDIANLKEGSDRLQ